MPVTGGVSVASKVWMLMGQASPADYGLHWAGHGLKILGHVVDPPKLKAWPGPAQHIYLGLSCPWAELNLELNIWLGN